MASFTFVIDTYQMDMFVAAAPGVIVRPWLTAVNDPQSGRMGAVVAADAPLDSQAIKAVIGRMRVGTDSGEPGEAR